MENQIEKESKKQEKERITGNLGKIFDNDQKKDFTKKEFESGNEVLNIRLKPNTEDWITVATWNNLANRTEKAINDGFKKFTFTGIRKEKEYEGKKYPYFQATEMAKLKTIQIEGKITSVRDKEAGDKTIKEALILDKSNKTYQIVVWPETNGADKVDLTPSNKIAINGEATFLDGGKREYVSIQSYDLAKDMETLKSIVEEKAIARKAELEEPKKETEAKKEIKTKKTIKKKEPKTKKTTKHQEIKI